MISSVRGTAVHVDADSVVVEVGGVGLSVAVTSQVARSTHVGQTLTLHTNLIVREDALSLFGFESRDELQVFTQLLGVTGVGPKSALGILSTLTVGADRRCRRRRRRRAVPARVGNRAQDREAHRRAARGQDPGARTRRAARGRLDRRRRVVAGRRRRSIGLGWSERIASEALESVAADAGEADRASVPALLRLTLAALGPARKEPVGG